MPQPDFPQDLADFCQLGMEAHDGLGHQLETEWSGTILALLLKFGLIKITSPVLV